MLIGMNELTASRDSDGIVYSVESIPNSYGLLMIVPTITVSSEFSFSSSHIYWHCVLYSSVVWMKRTVPDGDVAAFCSHVIQVNP